MLALLLAVPSLATTLPLESTSWEVSATGPLADIRVHQVFRNVSDVFIEATYIFPLDTDAAVDEMSIRIGNRTIAGAIEERDKAREAYEQAKAAGQVAALTEQERPNVFTQAVANIPPGERVVVDLHVVQPIEWIDDHYELVLPLVVGPRFAPKEQVPDADRILPAVATADTGLRADIVVDIEAGMPLAWIASPTHADLLDAYHDGTGGHAEVRGARQSRDFVLRWRPDVDGEPRAAAIRQGGHVLFQVVPPAAAVETEGKGREIIWVVDTSGSMHGAPLDLCKRAMTRAFDTMSARDSFLVMNFESTVSLLAEAPLPATPENIARGRAFVAGYQGQGGTNMIAGIRAALSVPHDPERQRIVVFLTDGYIGNEEQILAAIEDLRGDARLMSFGVGSSVNRYLLDEMSRAGQGTVTYVTLDEAPEDAVSRLLDTIARPMLSDIEIDWGGLTVDQPYPEVQGDLFAGRPIEQVALVGGQADAVTVRGRLGADPWEQVVPITWARSGDHSVGTTWARSKIAHLERQQRWGEIEEVKDEIVATALEYQLLTRYTSFVAIETIVRNHTGALDGVEQPVDLPDGVNYETSVSRRYTPPGDPLLTVEAPADARAVMAVFPWETAHLRWDPLRRRWFHRFLVPRDTPEGALDVEILIVDADGRIERRVERIVVDATAPELEVHLRWDGPDTVVTVIAEEPFRSIQVQPVGHPELRARRDIELADDVWEHEVRIAGHWDAVTVIAKDRAMNTVVQEAGW